MQITSVFLSVVLLLAATFMLPQVVTAAPAPDHSDWKYKHGWDGSVSKDG